MTNTPEEQERKDQKPLCGCLAEGKHLFRKGGKLAEFGGFNEIPGGPFVEAVLYVGGGVGGTPDHFGDAGVAGIVAEKLKHFGAAGFGHVIIKDNEAGKVVSVAVLKVFNHLSAAHDRMHFGGRFQFKNGFFQKFLVIKVVICQQYYFRVVGHEKGR
jgi:hypothetical protein